MGWFSLFCCTPVSTPVTAMIYLHHNVAFTEGNKPNNRLHLPSNVCTWTMPSICNFSSLRFRLQVSLQSYCLLVGKLNIIEHDLFDCLETKRNQSYLCHLDTKSSKFNTKINTYNYMSTVQINCILKGFFI